MVARTPKTTPSSTATAAARSWRGSRPKKRKRRLQIPAAMNATKETQAIGTWKKRMRLDWPMNPRASGA